MIGAIGVYLPAYRLIRRRRAPVLEAQFAATEDRRIDAALVGGAALFGIGWGIAGFCPGPAIVSIATATPAAIVFAAAMIGGTALCQLLVGRKSERAVGCGEAGAVSS
jgi:uncharacterized membrane protein YedE/YeeE